MPSGPVHQNDAMGFVRHMVADLLKMHLHGFGIGPWQHESGANASFGADRTEQIGVFVSLVCRLAWSGSFSGPEPRLTVLLADTRFILEPNLDRFSFRNIRYMGSKCVGEVFLKVSMTRVSCLGCCGRALMWEKPMAASSLEMVRSL